MSQSRLEQYLSFYQGLVRSEPDNVEARLRVAAIEREMGRHDVAADEYLTVARLLALQNLTLEAIAACKATLELVPGHAAAQSYLARLYAQTPETAGRGVRVAQPVGAEPAAARALYDDVPIALTHPKLAATDPDEVVMLTLESVRRGQALAIPEARLAGAAKGQEPVERTQFLDLEDLEDLEAMELPDLSLVGALRTTLQGDDLVEEIVSEGVTGELPRGFSEGASGHDWLHATLGVDLAQLLAQDSAHVPEIATEPDLMALILPGTMPADDATLGASAATPGHRAHPGEREISSHDELLAAPVFQRVRRTGFRRLMAQAVRREASAGETVWPPAHGADALHVIERGHVDLLSAWPPGRQELVASLGPGDFFGEFQVLGGRHNATSAVARAPLAWVVLPREAVQELAAEYPTVASRLWDTNRLRTLQQLLGSLPVFSRLEPAMRARMADAFEWIPVDAGQPLLLGGESRRGIALVVQGELRAMASGVGRAAMPGTSARFGAHFGVRSTLLGQPWERPVEALTDSLILGLTVEGFAQLCEELAPLAEAARAEREYSRGAAPNA